LILFGIDMFRRLYRPLPYDALVETGILGLRVRWIWLAVNVRTCPSGLSGSANDIHLSFCMGESKASSAIAAIVANQVDPTHCQQITDFIPHTQCCCRVGRAAGQYFLGSLGDSSFRSIRGTPGVS
jgi:hypothetical protein